MKMIYIAGPLFNENEKVGNLALSNFLQKAGYTVFLPQNEAGDFSRLAKKYPLKTKSVREGIFKKDIRALMDSNAVVALLDGRAPDEGTCVEIGFAYAKGIPVIGYKTDIRCFSQYGENIMLELCLKKICRTKRDLLKTLSNITK